MSKGYWDEYVYCTQCENINYNLECIDKKPEERNCAECPCDGCNCYDLEDSKNRLERYKYMPLK